jgi:hypothetical protein
MTQIVVARYQECVDWTKKFENVIIYNKGYPLPEEYFEILEFPVLLMQLNLK